MPTRSSPLIKALWESLPAATGRELAERVSERVGRSISVSFIHVLISRVRSNATTYGWTIPHVMYRYGRERYMRIPLAADSKFSATFAVQKGVEFGVMANVFHIAKRARNDTTALRALTAQMHPGVKRSKLQELAEDCRDLRRKTARIIRFIQEADGTNGN